MTIYDHEVITLQESYAKYSFPFYRLYVLLLYICKKDKKHFEFLLVARARPWLSFYTLSGVNSIDPKTLQICPKLLMFWVPVPKICAGHWYAQVLVYANDLLKREFSISEYLKIGSSDD